MREKIKVWANLWGINIENYCETERFAWFSVETDFSIRKIKTLEMHTGVKFDCVEWAENNRLIIWLDINVKGE